MIGTVMPPNVTSNSSYVKLSIAILRSTL